MFSRHYSAQRQNVGTVLSTSRAGYIVASGGAFAAAAVERPRISNLHSVYIERSFLALKSQIGGAK